MVENGLLKRSTLEKALVKIGAAASGDMNVDQFAQLIDIIQKDVDQKALLNSLGSDDDAQSTLSYRHFWIYRWILSLDIWG